jgi:hypothetical protein
MLNAGNARRAYAVEHLNNIPTRTRKGDAAAKFIKEENGREVWLHPTKGRRTYRVQPAFQEYLHNEASGLWFDQYRGRFVTDSATTRTQALKDRKRHAKSALAASEAKRQRRQVKRLRDQVA